jgi:hypothetical protein
MESVDVDSAADSRSPAHPAIAARQDPQVASTDLRRIGSSIVFVK